MAQISSQISSSQVPAGLVGGHKEMKCSVENGLKRETLSVLIDELASVRFKGGPLKLENGPSEIKGRNFCCNLCVCLIDYLANIIKARVFMCNKRSSIIAHRLLIPYPRHLTAQRRKWGHSGKVWQN
jgi:hypothetical protein